MAKSVLWLIGFLYLALLFNAVAAQDLDQPPPPPPNTQKLQIPFTPAQQALEALNLPENFKATLFAHEPDVIQPIAATTDSRGRLWVVECLTYSDRKQNYDLALHDRVVILEDVDQDGEFDKRTVFWDQGQKLTGIEIGFGGVWLTGAPHLLFVPDVDGDDRPDGPPKKLLDGFNGDEIRHNIVNGLRWGPDGWLYGRHGIQATSQVGPPGATVSQRTSINCSIWRYHPQSHKFEIVAEGGTNPWGFDFNDHGEMFMINTVIGHMFHVVPGARYRRMYGSHFNPHTYQVIEQTADHFHWDRSEEHWAVTKKEGMSTGTDAAGGGHAHTGLMCYLGDNWPGKYRNKWFTANFHGRRINVERAERDRCGYTARHEADMIKSDDPWFRGVEMIYGPDGGVFLLDWSDIGECHENDGIHRTSGRIFKITYGQLKKQVDFDLSQWTDQQLVDCNSMENQWYVRHARRLLQERFVDGMEMATVHAKLKAFVQNEIGKLDRSTPFDSRPTLRAMWALHSTGGASSDYLLKMTQFADEHVRAWAVRLLAQTTEEVSADVKTRLTEMASTEDSGLVRLYLASSLDRFSLMEDFKIFRSLVQHASDRLDRTQPHLIWNRVEPHVMLHSDQAFALMLESRIPIIRENIARRIASEIDVRPELVAKLLLHLDKHKLEIAADIGRGMKLALAGRTRVSKPNGWDEVYARTAKTNTESAEQPDLLGEYRDNMKKLNVIFGDGQGIAELRQIAKDKKAPVEARCRAISAYAATRPSELFGFLRSLVHDQSLSNAVIKAMVYCEQPDVSRIVLNKFGRLDPIGKKVAVETLASRPSWTAKLLQAVESKRLPAQVISAQHARQIADLEDDSLTERLSQVWGSIRPSDKARQLEMDRVRELCVENESLSEVKSLARYQVGRKHFVEKCSSCHVIYGAGSNVGPDLTGGDRKNLSYLLENILDPNASVADTYRATKFILADGRFISGVVLQKTPHVTRIQTATEKVVIENQEIEEAEPTKLSLMPDGLLNNMADDDIRALFYFLSSDRK